MELLIVTGMSGAGKSRAANVLEDIGYYCVDNIPPAIIPAFVDFSSRGNTLEKIAIVTDARGGDLFADINDVLQNLLHNNIDYKILFLDAADDVLIRRYKENRRRHPLADNNNLSVPAAVVAEREMLKKIRAMSDYVVDTSFISVSQLKTKLSELLSAKSGDVMMIQCKSFGFKYGSDTEADMVIDVRCLPNPFYIEELRTKTGLDQEVREYVLSTEESRTFYERLLAFLDCAVPLYIQEGKSQFIIATGCTGGKHRSVTFAELIHRHLEEKGYQVSVIHRDIYKS